MSYSEIFLLIIAVGVWAVYFQTRYRTKNDVRLANEHRLFLTQQFRLLWVAASENRDKAVKEGLAAQFMFDAEVLEYLDAGIETKRELEAE